MKVDTRPPSMIYLSEFMRPAPPEEYILVIVGSRLKRWVDPVGSKLTFYYFLDANIPSHVTTLMSGRSPALGVDEWTECYARDRNRKFIPCPPDFEKYGSPNAFYQRNQKMADDGDQVWAFLAPSASIQRSGAMQTARMFRRQHKPNRVFRITPQGVVELSEEEEAEE